MTLYVNFERSKLVNCSLLLCRHLLDVLCDYLLGNLGQKTGCDVMLSCQDGCVPCHQVMN